VSVSEIAHEAASRDGTIDLKTRGKDGICEAESWTAFTWGKIVNALAEVIEQGLKLLFFMGLRGVIGGPILRVGRFLDGICDRDGSRNGGTAIVVLVWSNYSKLC
jgi:hypothetical protein